MQKLQKEFAHYYTDLFQSEAITVKKKNSIFLEILGIK